MRRSRARPVRLAAGIAVWSVSWALAATAVGLGLRLGLPRGPLAGTVLSAAPDDVRALFWWIGVTIAAVYGPVAFLLFSRRVNAVGVILALHAVGSGLAAFGTQWGLLGAQQPGLPAWGLLAYAAGWGYVPGTFMTAVLALLVIPTRLPRGQRLLVAAGVANTLVGLAASLTQQSAPSPANPLAIGDQRWQAVVPQLYLWTSLVGVGLAVATGGILLRRWRRAPARSRASQTWLALGHGFLTVSYAVLVLPENASLPTELLRYGLAAPILGQLIFPAAILVAVLGQGLWGHRAVVSRILLWALLTFSGIALYLVAVLILGGLLPTAPGLAVLVPVVIAVAIQPLRSWIQRRIDQLVYGEGADPATLLDRLRNRIGELDAGPSGLRELCEALRRALRLASVELFVGPAAVAGAGAAVGEPVRIGLPGEPAGALVVTAPGGQRLDRRSLAVLRDLAGLMAAALHLAESSRQLDLVRDDLFARRAAERRTIQRELHDGLGPALAGIGFGLAAAANLADTDPVRASELLAELEPDLARRARSARSLAGEMLGSPLDGVPLPEALAELAARFRTPRLTVDSTVVAGAGCRLSPELQDAVYFIAAEALTNAARHSGATAIEVGLAVTNTAARVWVSDDGSGLPPQARPGVGLASMRQRARALDGDLELASSEQGVRVTATLPLTKGTIGRA